MKLLVCVFLGMMGTALAEQDLGALVTGESTEFGKSTSQIGNTLCVGDPDDGTTGSASFFTRANPSSAWTFANKVVPSGSGIAKFGEAVVCVHETVCYVSAPNTKDVAMTGVTNDHGYVFNVTYSTIGSTWSAGTIIRPEPPNARTHQLRFGQGAMHSDGVKLAVGTDKGLVYIIDLENHLDYTTVKSVPDPDTSQTQYGQENNIWIGGDRLFVGDSYDTAGSTDYGGAVYYYEYSDPSWTLTQTINSGSPQNPGLFGTGLDSDGDTLVVGAWYEDSQDGAVYILTRSGSTWTQQQRLIGASVANENMGFSVAFDTDQGIVAASGNDATYTFINPTGTWVYENIVFSPSTGQVGRYSTLIDDSNNDLISGSGSSGGQVWVQTYTGSGGSTDSPTSAPTPPTASPSVSPTDSPTKSPTAPTTAAPSETPTPQPTKSPTTSVQCQCENGGICSGVNDVACHCLYPYYGENCTVVKDCPCPP
jgi:hypothetical protein